MICGVSLFFFFYIAGKAVKVRQFRQFGAKSNPGSKARQGRAGQGRQGWQGGHRDIKALEGFFSRRIEIISFSYRSFLFRASLVLFFLHHSLSS